jgi:glycosyltransferase involved in cell wall biosynthesis
MQPVRVSVCIPVYNCRAHISEAVDSVLAQTFTDFELIIIDNSSTDGTYELLQGYHDPRIRLLRNPVNIGACGNWNRALQESSGCFVKLLCADDVIYPTCLQRQLEILESQDDELLMVTCSRDIIDETGRRLLGRRYPGAGGRSKGADVIRKAVRRGTNVIGEVSAVMFRRDIVKGSTGFDGSLPYVIDLDFWIRTLRTGDLYVIDEALCAYRVSRGAWSLSIADSQRSDFSAFIEKLPRQFGIQLSSIDVCSGHIMARVNALMRRVFYRLYL